MIYVLAGLVGLVPPAFAAAIHWVTYHDHLEFYTFLIYACFTVTLMVGWIYLVNATS